MSNLSPSALGDFKRCPRCFWLAKNKKIAQPRGIFPSLPGGMDRVIKPWYDQHREKGILPPEIRDFKGKLFDATLKLEKWRNWRTGLTATFEHNGISIVLSGAIDDLFVTDKNLFEPLDYKTRGAAPKHDGSSEQYYGTQLDTYALLFQNNGMPLSGKGHLVYYFPRQEAIVEHFPNSTPSVIDFGFNTEVVTLDVDPKRAIEIAIKATECLMESKAPDSHPNCEHCSWHKTLNEKGY
jgi:hypothetical protein